MKDLPRMCFLIRLIVISTRTWTQLKGLLEILNILSCGPGKSNVSFRLSDSTNFDLLDKCESGISVYKFVS
jgi:hypothetical protein